ncbi:hypothetical protein E9230_002302 [Corynebacterium glutamicum]|nr:hypothetical protein [Corynebacterium glutamicum]
MTEIALRELSTRYRNREIEPKTPTRQTNSETNPRNDKTATPEDISSGVAVS